MATALEVQSLPEPTVCVHAAFIAYDTQGGYPDDTLTMKGRCPECARTTESEGFFELWISRSTGEIWQERALTSAEILELRREAMA